MEYSENFERDYNWYLKWKDVFNFDGTKEYLKKSVEIYCSKFINNSWTEYNLEKIYSFKDFKQLYPNINFLNTLSVISEGQLLKTEFRLIIEPVIIENKNGLSAKECFYLWDSKGKIELCKEPELYYKILKCKGGINFNIKMWSQGRADGTLPKVEFTKECRLEHNLEHIKTSYEEQYELLPWMIEAVEEQKYKYYGRISNKNTKE